MRALVNAMKSLRFSGVFLRFSFLASFALGVCSSTAGYAAECPASSPDRTEERRALAKEWFARAEAAENEGNDIEAVKAYTCSMRMVAHAFTAYNLARVAERSGDLELALKSYRAYLTLKADAPDKEEVQGRIKDLQARINEVKEGLGAGLPSSSQTEPSPPEQKSEPIEPPPMPRPPIRVEAETSEPSSSSHILEWVVGGAGVATLTVGIITNILARGNMDTCNSKADEGKLAQAKSACDSAKTQAYTSYAMFGITGAIAAVESFLLYRLWAKDRDNSSDTSLSLGIAPNGLILGARGRF